MNPQRRAWRNQDGGLSESPGKQADPWRARSKVSPGEPRSVQLGHTPEPHGASSSQETWMTTRVWAVPGTPELCVSGVRGPATKRRVGLGLRHGEVPVGDSPASPLPGVRAAGSVPCPLMSPARATSRGWAAGVSEPCAEPGVRPGGHRQVGVTGAPGDADRAQGRSSRVGMDVRTEWLFPVLALREWQRRGWGAGAMRTWREGGHLQMGRKGLSQSPRSRREETCAERPR